MQKKILEGRLRTIWRQFWFRADTSEFTWAGRGVILAIAFTFGYMISYFLPELLDFLIPDSTKKYVGMVDGAWARLIVTAVATVYSVPIFLGLWIIRTHDKKIEFRNNQKQLSRIASNKKVESKSHRKQLSRSQIEKAVDLLTGKDPIARGLGVSRLTHLFRENSLEEGEYKGYMAICRSWESPDEGKAPMIALGSMLQGVNLQKAKLPGADLQEADLSNARLERANLQGANLQEANLTGTKLAGANLQGTNLQEADLTRASLRGACLRGANLQGANLTKTNLAGVHQQGADLKEIDLSGAQLQGANVDGSRMTAYQKQVFADQGVNVEKVKVVSIEDAE